MGQRLGRVRRLPGHRMKKMRIGWGVLTSWAIAALVVVAFAKQWVELPDR